MRRLLFAVLALCLATGAASAGDYADRTIIGFSPDGAYFAFEEYGVQDGSGFPYANIYVVDTATDSWVAGTPIRVMVQDETASLASVRFNAYEQANAILRAIRHRRRAARARHQPDHRARRPPQCRFPAARLHTTANDQLASGADRASHCRATAPISARRSSVLTSASPRLMVTSATSITTPASRRVAIARWIRRLRRPRL